jgi:tRNA G18 (ribose-2'-O)-methylase SpoU
MSRLSKKKKLPVIIVCENIRSAYNVGSIFRCADAARVQEIILVGITPTPLNKKVKKTSLGAEKTVPWRHLWNRETYIQDLQKKKFKFLPLNLQRTPSRIPHSVPLFRLHLLWVMKWKVLMCLP